MSTPGITSSPATIFYTPQFSPKDGMDSPVVITVDQVHALIQRTSNTPSKMARIQQALENSLKKSSALLGRLDEHLKENPVFSMSISLVGTITGGALVVVQPIAGAAILSLSTYPLICSLKSIIQQVKNRIQASTKEAKDNLDPATQLVNAKTVNDLPELNRLIQQLDIPNAAAITAADAKTLMSLIGGVSTDLIQNTKKHPKDTETLKNYFLSLKQLTTAHPEVWASFGLKIEIQTFLEETGIL